MRVLAVVPARGGSKAVPRKNIKILGDVPLIVHTLRAAHQAGRIDRTILSTDDPEIAEIGRSHGAEVPFLRPSDLASDSAPAIPVLLHALDFAEQEDQRTYDAVLMLQPTTPLRSSRDIDGALTLLADTGADSVISVTDVGGHHPARMKFVEGDRLVDPPYCEARENQPRQELTPMVIRNGAIYAVRTAVLRAGSLKGEDCRAWVMPAERSVNIDTELDFRLAELLLSEVGDDRSKPGSEAGA